MSTERPPTRPTIVLVPGGRNTTVHYKPWTDLLTLHGSPTTSVSLPTIDTSPPDKDHNGDIAAIESYLQKSVKEEGKDVLYPGLWL